MNRVEEAAFLLFCAVFGGMLFLQCSPAAEQQTLERIDEICKARAITLDAGADAR